MTALSLIAPGLLMIAGGIALAVACASAYERGVGSARALTAAGAASLLWAMQAVLWIQIGAHFWGAQ